MINNVFVRYLSIFTISGLIIFWWVRIFIIKRLVDNFFLKIKNFFRKIFNKSKIIRPKIVDINRIIVVRTTIILLLLGIAVILILEANKGLSSYNWF